MGENGGPRERGGPFKHLSAIAHWLTAKASLRRALESSGMSPLASSGGWSLWWSLGIAILPGGMSGFELARKIRELRPSLRNLLTSGFAGEIARAGEDAIHSLPMLRKPYSQIELARAIQATLKAEVGAIRQE